VALLIFGTYLFVKVPRPRDSKGSSYLVLIYFVDSKVFGTYLFVKVPRPRDSKRSSIQAATCCY